MEYWVAGAALLVGAIVGFLVAWVLLQGKYAAASVDEAHSEQVRELEKLLHQKDCDYLDELTNLKREMLAAQETHVRQAVAEARSSQREEFESQLKSFTVNISPYAEIREFRSGLGRRYRKISGYQYQLLVNGIPAFDPHIVREHDETSNSLDEEALFRLASRAADLVLQKYAGKTQILQKAAPVVRRLSGKKGDA